MHVDVAAVMSTRLFIHAANTPPLHVVLSYVAILCGTCDLSVAEPWCLHCLHTLLSTLAVWLWDCKV
jgi:hypothetical protein